MSAARELRGRRALTGSSVAFALGLLAGAGLVFGALGSLGAALQPGRAVVAVAGAVALAAAAIDAAGRRVRPQIRFQVPEGWRRTMPLSRALFLYGLLLGTGVTTYVPAAAAWALFPLTLALGSVGGALAIGASFAAGRALPVLVLAWRGEDTILDERPQGLRALRLLASLTLVLGIVALVAGGVRAATRVASPASDPSATGTELAWQQPGVGGFLSRNGETVQLPGSDPAIGSALIAWHSGTTVTVAARDTLVPTVQLTIPGVRKLAVSDRWLVERIERPSGASQILVQPLSDTAQTTIVASAKRGGQLGRPTLSGDLLLFHRATADGSWLAAVDLATGHRRVLRSSKQAQLLNPSLLGAKLLYVRVTRCAQELRIAPIGGGRERVLYKLPPLAGQDAGHEAGHTRQGEHPPCPYRPRPTARVLWTTALSSSYAYLTVLTPRRGGRTTPALLRIARLSR